MFCSEQRHDWKHVHKREKVTPNTNQRYPCKERVGDAAIRRKLFEPTGFVLYISQIQPEMIRVRPAPSSASHSENVHQTVRSVSDCGSRMTREPSNHHRLRKENRSQSVLKLRMLNCFGRMWNKKLLTCNADGTWGNYLSKIVQEKGKCDSHFQFNALGTVNVLEFFLIHNSMLKDCSPLFLLFHVFVFDFILHVAPLHRLAQQLTLTLDLSRSEERRVG